MQLAWHQGANISILFSLCFVKNPEHQALMKHAGHAHVCTCRHAHARAEAHNTLAVGLHDLVQECTASLHKPQQAVLSGLFRGKPFTSGEYSCLLGGIGHVTGLLAFAGRSER